VVYPPKMIRDPWLTFEVLGGHVLPKAIGVRNQKICGGHVVPQVIKSMTVWGWSFGVKSYPKP
jgi:hypothetical protein